MLGSIWLYRIWANVLELLAIFGQLSPFYVCQNFFTNSINQWSNTEKQSPIKIKFSTENKYVNGIQKVPPKFWCIWRPLMLQ